jgi:hypothetical protein
MLPASLLAPTREASKFSLQCLNLLIPLTHSLRAASPSHDSLRRTAYWRRGIMSRGGLSHSIWEAVVQETPLWQASRCITHSTPKVGSNCIRNGRLNAWSAHPLLLPSRASRLSISETIRDHHGGPWKSQALPRGRQRGAEKTRQAGIRTELETGKIVGCNDRLRCGSSSWWWKP